ncbi:MAG: RloB domain-containing protein [Aliarcobacter sp.]|nr:RloB domain-containing protein [Aliarcobacter sp.]
MPRERQEIFRESKTEEREKIIVLAFEGNITEQIYFEDFMSNDQFNDELIYLYLLKRPKDDTNSAPNHVFTKLKKEARDEYNFASNDELWMIIDKDRWKNIPEIIQECKKQKNMFVAVSNPCFEFWILLHLKDVDTLTEQEVLDILSNAKISSHKRYLDNYLGNLLQDGYNKTNPKPDRYFPYIDSAIIQAEKLDVEQEDYPTKIGSHVYKVMKKIKK